MEFFLVFKKSDNVMKGCESTTQTKDRRKNSDFYQAVEKYTIFLKIPTLYPLKGFLLDFTV